MQSLKNTRCCCTEENSIVDEVDQLKIQKMKLETDKESLLAAADDYVEKAEHSHKLT